MSCHCATPHRLCPLPPWVGQLHPHLTVQHLPKSLCNARAIGLGGFMAGSFALAAICHHMKNRQIRQALALGGCLLIGGNNNQLKVICCNRRDDKKEAWPGRSVCVGGHYCINLDNNSIDKINKHEIRVGLRQPPC